MSRAVPWRNKPTPFMLEMIQEVSTYKLYLVNELGPTSFVFKDDHQNKFKVTIGGKLSCSCGVVQNDHCLHTLYVLLKKYRVDQQNPILWQASYLDSELEGLVQYKYSSKRKPKPAHQFLRKHVEQQPKGEEDDFPLVGEDDSCPICYEVLKGECYSQCQQCHNCIHTKCLKVWVRHKQESGASVTCPMCRNEFNNPIGMIAKDTEKWNNRFLLHKGIKCVGCNMKHIKGVLFHCLHCQQANLCRLCFEDGQHSQHQHYLMKQQANGKWVIAPQREALQNRNPIYKSIHQRPQDTIEKALEIAFPSDPIPFLTGLFPSLREIQSRSVLTMGELNIVGNEVKTKNVCCKCSQLGNDLMRRLNCGHTVHEQCLQTMLLKGDYECDIDGQLILRGYLSATGIKPAKRVKKPIVELASNKNPNIRQTLEANKKAYQPPLLTAQSFQNHVGGPPESKKSSNISQSNKTSFTIRSNSLRRNVANRNPPQQFILIGNSNPLTVTGLHALQPMQPRTRSTIRQHF